MEKLSENFPTMTVEIFLLSIALLGFENFQSLLGFGNFPFQENTLRTEIFAWIFGFENNNNNNKITTENLK